MSRRLLRGELPPELTAREREVFGHMGSSRWPAAIAHDLFISTKTLESHMRNLMEKLGLNNTLELRQYAYHRKSLAT